MRKSITDIFNIAKEKGFKDISIRITNDEHCGLWFILHIGEEDRFYCPSLKSLLFALSEHKKKIPESKSLKIKDNFILNKIVNQYRNLLICRIENEKI